MIVRAGTAVCVFSSSFAVANGAVTLLRFGPRLLSSLRQEATE
jgi:hypothetical protein